MKEQCNYGYIDLSYEKIVGYFDSIDVLVLE